MPAPIPTPIESECLLGEANSSIFFFSNTSGECNVKLEFKTTALKI